VVAGVCVGLHRVAGVLLAGEFFRSDLGDTLIARRSGRGERVAGLPPADQLIVTDLGKVPVDIIPTTPRRLSLRRFLRRRRGRAYRAAVTVGRRSGGLAGNLDGLLGIHAIAEIR
jgi:hypothetical protein